MKASYWNTKSTKLEVLVGKTFGEVYANKPSDPKPDELIFRNSEEEFRLLHQQDCCEGVWIEEIIGELDWLKDSPILEAREDSSRENPPAEEYKGQWTDSYADSFTWTFFTISTVRGTVVIRFFGTSNGYYSESAELVKMILNAEEN